MLGKIPEDINSKNQTFTWGVAVDHKKKITVLWRNDERLTVQQWRESLKNVYLMESVTARLQLRTNIVYNKWSPITLQLPRLIKDSNST